MTLKWTFGLIVSGYFTFLINGVNASTVKKIEPPSPTQNLNQLTQIPTNTLVTKISPECLPNSELSLRAITLSSDPKNILAVVWSGSEKQFIKQWDLISGEEISPPFKMPLEISKGARGKNFQLYFLDDFVFAPDGKTLVGVYYDIVSSQAVVRFWKSKSGQEVRTQDMSFDPSGKLIGSIRISPDSDTLTWLGRDEDGSIVKIAIWDIQANKSINNFNLISDKFEPDISDVVGNNILARAKRNGIIRLQDLATGKIFQTSIETVQVYTLAFSSDDKVLFVGSRNGLISAWDTTSGKQMWSTQGHTGKISRLVNLDRKTLASSGDDGAIKLWDSADGKAIRTICISSSIK